MTNISDGTTTIVPALVTGYKADTEARNVVHSIIGRADPDVSLAADSPRTGDLEMLFVTKEAAWAAHALHAAAGVFTLSDVDVPEANMTYVRSGRMTITLDPDTRELWVLSVGFAEVAA